MEVYNVFYSKGSLVPLQTSNRQIAFSIWVARQCSLACFGYQNAFERQLRQADEDQIAADSPYLPSRILSLLESAR